MIDIKFIDDKSMLVLVKSDNGYTLLGPPYDMKNKKTMNVDSSIDFNLSLKYESSDQFKYEMQELQKMFAANINQSILMKYSGGMTKNFTSQEIKSIFIKRLKECIDKNNIPEMVFHELHALQMISGFSDKEQKTIKMALKYSENDVCNKINRRLSTPKLDYSSFIDRYLNSMINYTKAFQENLDMVNRQYKHINVAKFIRVAKPPIPNDKEKVAVDETKNAQEELLTALQQVKYAIAELIKNQKGDISDTLQEKISEIYESLNEKYKSVLRENGQFEVKAHQYKYMLEEPGLRLQKK
jgi:hypothetical protein